MERFRPGEEFALALDAADPLRGFRARFEISGAPGGSSDRIYLLGNTRTATP